MFSKTQGCSCEAIYPNTRPKLMIIEAVDFSQIFHNILTVNGLPSDETEAARSISMHLLI